MSVQTLTGYAVTNPATGETVKSYPTISDDELEAAVALAYKTHREWSRNTTVAERAALVGRVGELHSERREELAAITIREMGKPSSRRWARSTSASTSTATTPTTARS